jgi:hypothetical protein
LSGTYPNPGVAKVGGVAVTGTPAAGQVLTAAGATAAEWDGPASWLSVYGAPTGATAETFPRDMLSSSAQSFVSATAYVSLITLPKGLLVSNLTMITGGTAKTGGTHGWYALLDSGLVVRAVTADQTDAATVWGVGNTAYTLPFAATYTTPAAGLYYAMFCAVATQMPQLSGSVVMATGVSVTPLLAASSSSGQSTPPTTGTTMGALTTQAGKRFYAYTS